MQRVIYHCRGVGAFALLNDAHAGALRPYGELIGGRGSERVAGDYGHALAFLAEQLSEFAHRSGFAHSVHAGHKDDKRILLFGNLEIQQVMHNGFQLAPDVFCARDVFLVHDGFQFVENGLRRFAAYIR